MKNWSKFTLAIAFLATYAMSAPSIWNGTADISWYESSAQAYNLTTAEQLAGLAQLVNDGTSDFSGKTITIGADIFLNDTTGASDGSWSKKSHRMWTPIGTQSTPFKGEFDGLAGKKNRKIYGLYINDTTKNYVGLFGYTDGVKISNIDLLVGQIVGNNTVGALIGSANGGSVENVNSEIDVNGRKWVGGIVGWASSSMTDCVVNASIVGQDIVGGLAGYASAMIKNSNYVGGLVKGNNYVGGLVGFLTKSVADSYSETYVEGRGNNVGGLIGFSFTRETDVDVFLVSKTYFKGTVKGEDFVGGLIGKDSTYDSMGSYKKYFINSFSEGDVNGSGNVGGLFGSVVSAYDKGMSIDSCYHKSGNVVATSNYVGGLIGRTYNRYLSLKDVSHSNGYVEGMGYVGGLVGYHYAYSSSVKNAFANAHVKGRDYTGGLIGYSAAEIDDSYHIGNVYGGKYVGGVAGWSIYTINNSFNKGYIAGSNIVGGLVGRASDVSNSFSEGSVAGKSYVGGLVGISEKNVVSSFASGEVVGDENYIGGLIGLSIYEGGSKITIYSARNSYAIGNVIGVNCVGGLIGLDSINRTTENQQQIVKKIAQSYSEGSVIGHNYVGGIVGKVNHGHKSVYYAGSNVSSIDSVYHIGSVLGNFDYIGGIVGYTFGNILNSQSISSVKGQNTVGGIAGSVGSSVTNSYFVGDSVTGIYQVGGLLGVANGKVDSSYSVANVKGDDNVGGLIGSSYSDISNSFALGNVIGDVDHSSAGNDNLGGLVGYVYSGSISKSLAKGNVSGTTKLGGIVGRFDGTSITQSYANGNVTGNYYGDPADEVGNFYIGGLVGYAKGSVSESYASGIVKGMAEDPVYTGCLIGYVDGSLTIDDSYFDNEKCSLDIEGKKGSKTAGATIANSSGKTTAEMQDEMTFANWDFANTWNILDDSYPFLLFFANSFVNADVTTASLKNMVYDGKAKTPAVTKVELGGVFLEENSDYQVSYQNNIDAGTASIKICGLGVYLGCKIIPFTIAPISLKISLGKIENQVYDTFEKTPAVSIYEGESLMDDKNFSVEYANNINAGTASVRVSLTGNYSGSASTTFTIEKAKSIIEELPTAGEIFYGQTLKKSSLEGGSANVEGSFVWSKTDIVPDPVNDGYEVKFVPKDAANYLGATGVVSLVVKKCVVSFTFEGTVLQLDSLMYGDVPQFDGDLPKKNSAQYEYAFKTWSPKIAAVTGNQTYVAVFDSSLRKYTISFYNGDSLLQSSEVEYGSTPTLKGSNPKKAMSEGFSYTFKGWSPKIVSVTNNADYFAVFDSTLRKYTITFKNGSTTLQTSDVEYGTKPSYTGITPTKTSTTQYTYAFKGWNPTIVSVTGVATYTAVFDSTLRKYTITFKNGTTTLQTSDVAYGTKPSYTGSTPTKTSTTQYTYTFKGWNPTIASVTDAATYTAVFDSTLRKYTVTFKNGSTTLQTSSVAYGTKPSYTGSTPMKTSTDKYSYTFKGWSPTLASVTGAATYTAVFDSTVRKYTVTFKNGTTTLQTGDVAYGTKPSYTGSTPTKKATNKYTYKFKGWNPAIATVTKAATYQAVFDSTKVTGIVEGRLASLGVVVSAVSRTIQISAAPKNSTYAILDMQGRVLFRGRVESANFNIAMPNAGNYLVRVGKVTRKVQVK